MKNISKTLPFSLPEFKKGKDAGDVTKVFYLTLMLKLYPLLILAAFLFWGCPDTGYVPECGGEEYPSEKQFCFNDTLYDKCDGKEYNPSNQKCEDNISLSKCGDDYYNPDSIIQFCFDDVFYDKCNGNVYNPSNQKCENNILLFKCGNDYYNPDSSDQFCANDIFYDKCGGKSYNIKASIYCSNDSLVFDYGTLTDSRDNKIYRTIRIGNQVWMAENLRYKTSDVTCYKNNPDNCEIVGIPYYWNEAITICPSGWHLPNNEEWGALITFAGPYAGRSLKAKSDLWEINDGSDEFGFAALPGGYDGFYVQSAFFHSATKYENGRASYYTFANTSFLWGSNSSPADSDSFWAYVRCVEN
jgi:uncharacterized protein (TIGR02145 family)